MGRFEADITLESWLFGFRPCWGRAVYPTCLFCFSSDLYCLNRHLMLPHMNLTKHDLTYHLQVTTY